MGQPLAPREVLATLLNAVACSSQTNTTSVSSMTQAECGRVIGKVEKMKWTIRGWHEEESELYYNGIHVSYFHHAGIIRFFVFYGLMECTRSSKNLGELKVTVR